LRLCNQYLFSAEPLERAKADQCLKDLMGSTDPRADKIRIEKSKDPLLKDCYSWLLEDHDFCRWKDSHDTQLLWIKGDPGKGKTMIMIALVNELSERVENSQEPYTLSYFFCRSTEPLLRSATYVLRGLIYMLASQQRSLIKHVRKRYDDRGKEVFEGESAIYTLQSIFLDMLRDSNLQQAYFLVDALDECDIQLRELLKTIADEIPQAATRVKWIVSSRNQREIEEDLGRDGVWKKISLELNSNQVSRGVDAYINFKVDRLARSKEYKNDLKAEVMEQLRKKAEGTFLWVHLACERLENISLWGTKRELESIPRGLNQFYERMVRQIMDRDDFDREICKKILRLATVAYRPLRFQEIIPFLSSPEEQACDIQELTDMVGRCGSFLTIREETIYFIHQSARDYFASGDRRKILPFDELEEHGKIVHRSLDIMSRLLRKDMYGLEKRGTIAAIGPNNGIYGSLVQIEYMCHYWVRHLICYTDSGSGQENQVLLDNGEAHKFLQNHFLHWIEALALIGQLTEGILMIRELESKINVSIVRPNDGL
jgi:hypothetical protein